MMEGKRRPQRPSTGDAGARWCDRRPRRETCRPPKNAAVRRPAWGPSSSPGRSASSRVGRSFVRERVLESRVAASDTRDSGGRAYRDPARVCRRRHARAHEPVIPRVAPTKKAALHRARRHRGSNGDLPEIINSAPAVQTPPELQQNLRNVCERHKAIRNPSRRARRLERRQPPRQRKKQKRNVRQSSQLQPMSPAVPWRRHAARMDAVRREGRGRRRGARPPAG